MSIQDPIANMFSSINNAQARNKEVVRISSSSKKIALLSMLKQEGYIYSFETSEGAKPEVEIKLKYYEGSPVIKQLKRISKPGLRQYSNYKDLPEINGGLGIAIVSTSKGLMTDHQAREEKVGGELICSVF